MRARPAPGTRMAPDTRMGPTGASARGEDAGVEDAGGVEGALERGRGGEVGGGAREVQPRRLGDPDAVLGRDRAPEARRGAEDVRRQPFGVAGFEDVDVDVALGEVAER